MNPRKMLCCLILPLGLVVIPSTSYAQATSDIPSVTAQLNDAKTTVAKVWRDAVQLGSCARPDTGQNTF
jgi:hypothetical protein